MYRRNIMFQPRVSLREIEEEREIERAWDFPKKEEIHPEYDKIEFVLSENYRRIFDLVENATGFSEEAVFNESLQPLNEKQWEWIRQAFAPRGINASARDIPATLSASDLRAELDTHFAELPPFPASPVTGELGVNISDSFSLIGTWYVTPASIPPSAKKVLDCENIIYGGRDQVFLDSATGKFFLSHQSHEYLVLPASNSPVLECR